MRYNCHTDAAYDYRTKNSGLAYVIITEYDFVNADSYTTDSPASIYEAEVLAIGLALAYIQTSVKLNKGDSIEILSDSKEAIKTYELFLANEIGISKYSKQMQRSLKLAKKLANTYELYFIKERAHKDKLSLNTLVDRFAKIAVRGQ